MTEEQSILRPLPHAVGPEKSVLSCILQDATEYLPRCQEVGIEASSFYLPAHQAIFRTIADVVKKTGSLDIITLTSTLHTTGDLERHGGPSTLADLFTYNPAANHFAHHCRIVTERAALREMIKAANSIIEEAYSIPDDVPASIDTAEKSILAIRDRQFCDKPPTVEDDIKAIIEDYRHRWAGSPRDPGIPTGIHGIDEITLGLRPGEMFVIGARPSVGKTALMLNMAGPFSAGLKAIAKELEIPVVVLAQLNREVEKRTGRSAGPRMSDLKDSGSIEADADVIGLLHRADYQGQNIDGPGAAELIIAKNRNGPTGPVPMTYIAELMTFENGSPVQEEPQEVASERKTRWDS
jgi:replicative DNA helicase